MGKPDDSLEPPLRNTIMLCRFLHRRGAGRDDEWGRHAFGKLTLQLSYVIDTIVSPSRSGALYAISKCCRDEAPRLT